ncbi:MAG: potassium transporter [Betaproteobacteria bacterium]|jgi:CPA2 family monovalent cation:H+ antiporter-2|nr:potassium transporter [Betaproteobacteria bacterium]
MTPGLLSVLLLLAGAVLAVVAVRTLRLPALFGYVLVGVVLGPNALGWVRESTQTETLAEFGIVFLMFTLGLEFSLPRLRAMRGLVFGVGGLQVLLTSSMVLLAGLAFGLDWRSGLVLGGALAMSSTAMVGKLLVERHELESLHGRLVMGVLLFQDLAVVPLLILIPALAGEGPDLLQTLGMALLKGAVVLALVIAVGPGLTRRWFHLVAERRSEELFMLNVLLTTLALAALTEAAGLSAALGAFLAGMLISETEYRYQVEADIRPFRDVLLGLFFVTVGMHLNVLGVLAEWQEVLLLTLLLMSVKAVLAMLAARTASKDRVGVMRTGIYLAQAGEFALVLLSLAEEAGVLEARIMASALPAVILSMLATPLLIEHSPRLLRRFNGSEWMNQALQLTQIAMRSMGAEQHVVICGYGRTGQQLARVLARDGVSFIALDTDPQHVQSAAATGETVVFGDAARREVLQAAGIQRARALVITFAETQVALAVLAQAQALRPDLPVLVRTRDDQDIERLRAAGATEVVAEVMEASVMLASQTLMLAGVPLNRVLREMREMREQRYDLFRGFFHGITDDDDGAAPRLQALQLPPVARAVGRTLGDCGLDGSGVVVKAVRRGPGPALVPDADLRFEAGDTLVLLGTPEQLAAAELVLI